MGKFVRYTCAKKNEPTLREDCLRCSEYNPCAKDGQWCFVGALIAEHDSVCTESVNPDFEDVAAPVFRDMSTMTINLGNGMEVDVLKEDIKKSFDRDFYKKVGMMFGA